jgi:hypothetical protein
MGKNKLKFVMDTDWIFDGVIDAELKQYVLLGYFQKLNKQLEEMKVYPMFTEITLHLANVQSIIKNNKILYTDKKLTSYDDELTFIDLKTKELPPLKVNELNELKSILEYSVARLQDYFDIIKSVWTVVYDSIEIITIFNEDNLESKKGYFYTKSNQIVRIWEYNVRKYKGVDKFVVTEKHEDNLLKYIHSVENKLPSFYLLCEKEVPMDETLFPLFKRKVMSFVLQTKNLAIR